MAADTLCQQPGACPSERSESPVELGYNRRKINAEKTSDLWSASPHD